MREIYWIRESLEKGRPKCVAYNDPTGWFETEEGYAKHQENSFVSAGEYAPEQWFVPDLVATEKGTSPITDWDYFECPGTFGAFSQRAIEVLEPYLRDRFLPLSANIAGIPYYSLHCRSRVDCLNRDTSQLKFYADSEEVRTIVKYAFREKMLSDAMVFAIPEVFLELHCTATIPRIATKAGLRGFDFQRVTGGRK